jgi:hypothetical protein
VRGFSKIERQLLEGTVRLSQRRNPRLELVAEDKADTADVVMIDALDAQAVRWGEQQFWLAAGQIWSTQNRGPVTRRQATCAVADPAHAVGARAGARRHCAAAAAPPRQRLALDLICGRECLSSTTAWRRNYPRSLLRAAGQRSRCVAAALKVLAAERFDCALMDVDARG